MKKFIKKVILFTFPFYIFYMISSIFYVDYESGPDLLRLGYIPDIDKNYRKGLKSFSEDNFVNVSKANEKFYEILTIGDSFSEQGADGYKNFLASDFKVLHIDRFISKNPFQTLINLCNGDFFDIYKVKYVILQNVERHLIDNINDIDINSKINNKELDSLILNHNIKNNNYSYKFFSSVTIEFPLYYCPKYLLCNNYLSNDQVYNLDVNVKSLFSNNSDKLLFYKKDLENTKKNNLIENAKRLNHVLNEIAEILDKKNIKLIMLPSPDKYDLYYNFIVDKNKLVKPVFFDNFKKLKKEYVYIDSKEILSEKINSVKDLYYFDDTHWSPIASKIIASKIKEEILFQETTLCKK